jgi:hypothetical protein
MPCANQSPRPQTQQRPGDLTGLPPWTTMRVPNLRQRCQLQHWVANSCLIGAVDRRPYSSPVACCCVSWALPRAPRDDHAFASDTTCRRRRGKQADFGQVLRRLSPPRHGNPSTNIRQLLHICNRCTQARTDGAVACRKRSKTAPLRSPMAASGRLCRPYSGLTSAISDQASPARSW